jgi:single-strand DNA-binding protein
MIKLQAIGHLGKNSEVNNVNGKNVINFNVAHTEKFKDAQGNQKEKTIWVSCAYWTDRTAIAPYLKKGTQVYVEGQPDINLYTTKDGKQGANIILRVQTVQLLGASGGGQNPTQAVNANTYRDYGVGSQAAPEITEPLDDLPF